MKSSGARHKELHPPEDRGRESAAPVFVRAEKNGSALTPYNMAVQRVPKPWGYELVWAHTSHYAGKILWIRRGCRLSFQFHEHKHESIYLLSGTLELEMEDDEGRMMCHSVRRGEIFHVPACRRHRL